MEASQHSTPQNEPNVEQQKEEKSNKVTSSHKVVKYLAPLGVIALTIVFAVVLIVNKDSIKKSATTVADGPQDTAQVAGSETNQGAQAADISKVNIANDPYIGNENAKVVVAYWSDFQCPYCKQFELATMPALIQNYVNSGKIKLVFKDFQFLGNDSLTAALYARAIWELYPKEYFPWREALYNKQDTENGGFGDETSIKALTATIVGIDVNKVTSQIASKSAQYQSQITADRSEGASMGVTGTPGFITGKKLISGAANLSAFSQAIDPQL